MSEPTVQFRLCLEGDDHEIIAAIRTIEPDISSDKKYEPGPMLDEYLGSRCRMFDDDSDSPVTGHVTVESGTPLLRLLGAVAGLKHLDSWYLAVSVDAEDGVSVYASLQSGRFSDPGRATAEVRMDRKKMVGAIVERVKEAQTALDRALAGERP